jgi:hypothetical protein
MSADKYSQLISLGKKAFGLPLLYRFPPRSTIQTSIQNTQTLNLLYDHPHYLPIIRYPLDLS